MSGGGRVPHMEINALLFITCNPFQMKIVHGKTTSPSYSLTSKSETEQKEDAARSFLQQGQQATSFPTFGREWPQYIVAWVGINLGN